jgi:hypothetical protein
MNSNEKKQQLYEQHKKDYPRFPSRNYKQHLSFAQSRTSGTGGNIMCC